MSLFYCTERDQDEGNLNGAAGELGMISSRVDFLERELAKLQTGMTSFEKRAAELQSLAVSMLSSREESSGLNSSAESDPEAPHAASGIEGPMAEVSNETLEEMKTRLEEFRNLKSQMTSIMPRLEEAVKTFNIRMDLQNDRSASEMHDALGALSTRLDKLHENEAMASRVERLEMDVNWLLKDKRWSPPVESTGSVPVAAVVLDSRGYTMPESEFPCDAALPEAECGHARGDQVVSARLQMETAKLREKPSSSKADLNLTLSDRFRRSPRVQDGESSFGCNPGAFTSCMPVPEKEAAPGLAVVTQAASAGHPMEQNCRPSSHWRRSREQLT